jgi:hypothetical protein
MTHDEAVNFALTASAVHGTDRRNRHLHRLLHHVAGRA